MAAKNAASRFAVTLKAVADSFGRSHVAQVTLRNGHIGKWLCRRTLLMALIEAALLMALIDEAARPQSCLQARLLAALALCSCDSAGLSQLGTPALLQAFQDSTNAASKPTGRHLADFST